MDETRPITQIYGPGEDGFLWRTNKPEISQCHCERIVPYWEPGQAANVVWFVVYGKDDVVLARVNSAFVEQVRYD